MNSPVQSLTDSEHETEASPPPPANKRNKSALPPEAPEPRVSQTTSPAPDSSQNNVESEDLDKLLVDVFELTGQKVTLDDPILVAALIQSTLVKRAGDDAANSLKDAVINAVSELAQAVKVEREQAANLDKTMAQAFQQLTDGAKKAGDQEVASMQVKFSRHASEVLEQVRQEASKQAPANSFWKLLTIAVSALCLGMLLGVLISKTKTPELNGEQIRLIHNGMLLDNSWQKLPKSSRELIENSESRTDEHSGDKANQKAKKP